MIEIVNNVCFNGKEYGATVRLGKKDIKVNLHRERGKDVSTNSVFLSRMSVSDRQTK